MPRYLTSILCVFGSTGLFFCVFSLLQWTNKNPERQDAAERFVARLAAYPICAFIVLLPYALKDHVADELSDALFLGSVILCRIIAFLINRFWVSNAINNSFKAYIYGFILAFALITLYYEGWLAALPIFVYFLSFYIDFDFADYSGKDTLLPTGQKGTEATTKGFLGTSWKEYLLAIINCIVIILAYIFIPMLDKFLLENWIAHGLPWLVLISYYIFAVIYGKKRQQQPKKSAKRQRSKHC